MEVMLDYMWFREGFSKKKNRAEAIRSIRSGELENIKKF